MVIPSTISTNESESKQELKMKSFEIKILLFIPIKCMQRPREIRIWSQTAIFIFYYFGKDQLVAEASVLPAALVVIPFHKFYQLKRKQKNIFASSEQFIAPLLILRAASVCVKIKRILFLNFPSFGGELRWYFYTFTSGSTFRCALSVSQLSPPHAPSQSCTLKIGANDYCCNFLSSSLCECQFHVLPLPRGIFTFKTHRYKTTWSQEYYFISHIAAPFISSSSPFHGMTRWIK